MHRPFRQAVIPAAIAIAGQPIYLAIFTNQDSPYVVSLLFGPVSGLVRQVFPGRHLEA